MGETNKFYTDFRVSFQKVNFLRDLKDDIEERGRIYLPGVHKEQEINEFNKAIFEKEIEEEFHEAHIGIMKLPFGVRLGVYLAYIYYLTLFKKLKLLNITTKKSKNSNGIVPTLKTQTV